MTTASSRGSGEIPSRLHYSTGGAGMSSPTASASKRPEMGSRQHLQVPPATPGRSASDAADYHSSSTSQRDDESSTAETVAAPITQAELLKEAVRLRDWEQRLETREQVLHAAEAQLHVDQQMLETRIQELAQQAPDEGVDMQGGGTASGGHTSVTSPGEGSPPARESYAAMVKVQPTTGSGGGGGGDGGISGAEGDRDHGV